MKHYQIFLYVYSLLAGAACLFMQPTSHSFETLIISMLVIACLLGLRLLLILAGKLSWLRIVLLFAALGITFFLGTTTYPLACIILLFIARQLSSSTQGAVIPLLAALVTLLALITQPSVAMLSSAVLCITPLLFLQSVVHRLHLSHQVQENQSEENEQLRRQITDVRKMSATAEHAARITERNRLATRIHDKVGHGISGSIILLEGARLSMDKDPGKAKEAIELATENLRTSVDEIRAELRAERTKPSESGLAQISAQLTKFSAQHANITTKLATNGDVSKISPQVWVCIQENLTEALTNILKHSNATRLDVSISVQNKLAKVSFKDNGNAQGYTQGMGLTAMVERCATCRGNCFFSASPQGFSIIMTFMYIGNTDI